MKIEKADTVVSIVSFPRQINSIGCEEKENERKIFSSDVLLFRITMIPPHLPASRPTPRLINRPTAVWSEQEESSRFYYRRVYGNAFTPFAAVSRVRTANRLQSKNSDSFWWWWRVMSINSLIDLISLQAGRVSDLGTYSSASWQTKDQRWLSSFWAVSQTLIRSTRKSNYWVS